MSSDVKFDLPPAKPPKESPRWPMMLVILIVGGVIGFLVKPTINPVSWSESAGKPGTTARSVFNPEELTQLAETLEQNQLYAQAARIWQQSAELSPPKEAEKSELLFRIGKNLSLAGEQEEALTYLFAAESADSEAKWKTSINRLVMENLSALGREDVRAYQAKRRLVMEASESKDEAKVLADIGGEQVTEVDLQSFARRTITEQLTPQRRFLSDEEFAKMVDSRLEHFNKPEGKKQLLESYISQEVLYREALAGGLPERREVRRRIDDVRKQILISAFLDDYLDQNLRIDDTDARNAYEANKQQYIEPEAVKVEAIVADSDQVKKEITEALDGGMDFSELRDKYKQEKSAESSTDPFDRWLTRDDWVPMVSDHKAVLAHLFTLDKGEISKKWFAGSDGRWLRFRLTERRNQRQLAFDECRDRVERDLRALKQEELLKKLQQSLQRKYEVVVHETPTTQP